MKKLIFIILIVLSIRSMAQQPILSDIPIKELQVDNNEKITKDTILIYWQNKRSVTEWKLGYFVTYVLRKDDLFMYFNEPEIWLDSLKLPMDKPRRFSIRY